MRISQVFAAVAIAAASFGVAAQTVTLTNVGNSGVVASSASFDGGNNYYTVAALEYFVNNGTSTFAAFCIEPFEYYFGTGPTAFSMSTLDAGRNAELSKLFTGAGWAAQSYASDAVMTDSQSAGLALAVWDIALDGTLDFNSGSFRVAADAQTAFATAAYGQGNESMANALFSLQNGDYQDMVSAVPEPSTYALLVAGLAGVGFVARRRQRAAV